MEDEAQKRKERLKAMQKRKQNSESAGRASADTEKTVSFRSYTPKDEELRSKAKIATPADITNTIETETKDVAKETLQKAEEANKEEVDLFNLAPKKQNWDLKRDVEKKLEKLDKRTQRAILELIRERLQKEGDLSGSVANAEALQKLEAEAEKAESD